MRHHPARMVRTKSATNADFDGNIVHASTKALLDKQCERNDDEAVRIRGLSRMQFPHPLGHHGLACACPGAHDWPRRSNR